MWKIILLVWLVPLAIGLWMLTRVLSGKPALNGNQWLWFLDGEEQTLSPWWWFKFGALLVLFLAVGFIEGLVVINIGGWLLAAPLLTGVAAMFVAAQWLCQRPRRATHRSMGYQPARGSKSRNHGEPSKGSGYRPWKL